MMNRRVFLAGLAASATRFLDRHVTSDFLTSLDTSRLGASTACLAGFTLTDAIQKIRQLGFSTIEIIAYTGARHSVGDIPGFDFYKASEGERALVYKATRSFKHISAHMPFQGLQLLSPIKDVRDSSIEQIKRGMDGLSFLKGQLAVVHVGAPDKGTTYKQVWQQSIDTFRFLGDYAARLGLKVGIETMQPNSVIEYTGLIREINHPSVGATIDTGHIRGAADIGLPVDRRDSAEGRQRFNDVLCKIVELLGEKVLHFHLTDVKGADWRDHHTVGTGIVDFPRLFGLIKKQGFKGLLIFELEEQDRINALISSKSFIERLMKA
jgi:sugar phosphate isomerase/epimerase